MPEPIHLAKAVLQELTANFQPKTGGKKVPVQFNPETLSVHFSNQVKKPNGAGSQGDPAVLQFIGEGATSLSITLWFDVNAPGIAGVDDVRKLTQDIVYFITPQKETVPREKAPRFISPAVSFLWGSFQFDGVMDDLKESLEFFSSEGVPLRASVAFRLSRQGIHFAFGEADPYFASPGPLGPGAGTTPLVQAPAGISLQQLADQQGQGANWQNIAAANNIENPRILKAGLPINLNIS